MLAAIKSRKRPVMVYTTDAAIEELEYDVFTHAGVTPLMMAVESRNIELVAACLRANFNPFLHDALNHTAMDYANFGRE